MNLENIIKSRKLYFDKMTFEKINGNLSCALAKKYPAMFKEVLEQEMCDVDGTFLGFVDTYYFLSKTIPQDWTVIDFGCAYNPQAYFFRKHKKFIGVDVGKMKRFSFPNTEIFIGTIAEYLKQKSPAKKVFAICNNVPSEETEMVRRYYPNCFVYYVA